MLLPNAGYGSEEQSRCIAFSPETPQREKKWDVLAKVEPPCQNKKIIRDSGCGPVG